MAIRLQRVRLRLSQHALGDLSGRHRNYVGAIERGEINPTYGTLRSLAGALDVAVWELLRGADRLFDEQEARGSWPPL